MIHSEARVRQGADVLEQGEPPHERDLVATPIGHQVAEPEQCQGPQQEAVEFERGLGGGRDKADGGEQRRRHEGDAEARPKAPLKGSDHDGEEEEKEKDAVRATAEPDQQHIPPDVNPVRDGRQRQGEPTPGVRTEHGAVGDID